MDITAPFLEVFTEKLFGLHDCTFIAAYFKVCDMYVRIFYESETLVNFVYFMCILIESTVFYYFCSLRALRMIPAYNSSKC